MLFSGWLVNMIPLIGDEIFFHGWVNAGGDIRGYPG